GGIASRASPTDTRNAIGIGGGGVATIGAGGGGGGGGGAAAFALSSSNPTASVRKSESGGRFASAATAGSVNATSTWLKPVAAAAKDLRSNAALASLYFCWMIAGSIRRRTSANADRIRGETSLSLGCYDGSAATTASIACWASAARPSA